MTLEKLQSEMVAALKAGQKERKTAISGYIAAIKKAAIDRGCRDNISEEMVNTELIKIQKSVQEQITTCPASRPDLLEKYMVEKALIDEFAPSLIKTPERIRELIYDDYTGPITKKDLMKFLNANYRGRMDMGIASKVVDVIVKGV